MLPAEDYLSNQDIPDVATGAHENLLSCSWSDIHSLEKSDIQNESGTQYA